jgi:hypothetical protein
MSADNERRTPHEKTSFRPTARTGHRHVHRRRLPCSVVALALLLCGTVVLSACGKEKITKTAGTSPSATGATSTAGGGQGAAKRLIFIHHSTGENWLADDNGGLGKALADRGYFVSDTNYGWGPNAIGDRTDIGNWWEWFRGPDSGRIMAAVYSEGGQNCSYTRLDTDPGGQNEIIMFKSCFPNSALRGSPDDPVPAIDANPLKGKDAGSEVHTVANAKGIYTDLLQYFRQHPDKLFVVVTAPPLSDQTYAANARAFNDWLLNDWLSGYDVGNVAVFDLYGVLTDGGPYFSADGDDHPSQEGNRKAVAAFVDWLDQTYANWNGGQ